MVAVTPISYIGMAFAKCYSYIASFWQNWVFTWKPDYYVSPSKFCLRLGCLLIIFLHHIFFYQWLNFRNKGCPGIRIMSLNSWYLRTKYCFHFWLLCAVNCSSQKSLFIFILSLTWMCHGFKRYNSAASKTFFWPYLASLWNFDCDSLHSGRS